MELGGENMSNRGWSVKKNLETKYVKQELECEKKIRDSIQQHFP